MKTLIIKNETAMQALGAELANLCPGGTIIHLEGELGAGKTTFARGFIRSTGYKGAVKSPTYTLVESYPFNNRVIHHFDLYRLCDAEELELMGIRDYFTQHTVVLIEWPDKGGQLLPIPDLTIKIYYKNTERKVTLIPHSLMIESIIKKITVN